MQNGEIYQLGLLIKAVNTLVEKELNNQVRKLFNELKLTGPQVLLMTYLYEAQSRTVSQKELETVFAISHPTIRSIVKRLEKQDLINISTLKNDKRQVILSLSSFGFTLIDNNIEKIYKTMKQVNKKITVSLSTEEQRQLLLFLKNIIHNFNM